MSGDPRVWKWMVPAFGMVAMLPLGLMLNSTAESNDWPWLLWCNWLVVGMVPLLGIQAWAAFGAYYRHQAIQDYVDRRNADATTAEVKMFEYGRAMHPETVRLLLLHRKTIWRVLEAKPNEMADWVLDADRSVRLEFVEYVLQNSTRYALMPINRLSDGAYSFDPEKLITDRDQYRALHKLLVERYMVTEAFGNQSGQWIEPWQPELVAARWGIRLEDEDEQAGNGQETIAKPETNTERDSPASASVPKPRVEAKPLTDEEMAEIHRLEEEHATRYTMTVKEYHLKHKS